MRDKTLIKSIEKAAIVLEVFTKKEPELTLNDLSQKTGFNKTTLLRICNTLCKVGYLEKLRENQFPRYRIGVQLLKVGNLVAQSMDLEKRAKPYLEELVEKTGDTSYLMIERNEKAHCILREEGTHIIRTLALEVGDTLELNIGAGPILLLSYMKRNERERIINSLKKNESSDLRNRLLKVKQKGYSISKNQVYTDTAAVAVPIFNHDGNAIAALSVGGLLARFSEERLPIIINEIVEIGRKLSQELGYQLKTEITE